MYRPDTFTVQGNFSCPYLTHNPEYSFNGVKFSTCPAGSFCKFPGSDPEACPPGFFCPTNTTQPTYCCPGFFCQDSSTIQVCPRGKYCQAGSTQPEGCYAFANCPPGTEKPTRLGIFLFFLVLVIVVNYILHVRRKLEERRRKKYETIALNADADDPEHRHNMTTVERTFNIRCENLGRQLPNGTWIMRNVSLTLHAGRTMAIMGPSGAGKSTFISLLTNKAPRTSGKVFVNEVEEELSKYQKLIGFVPQEDIMLRELTVRDIIVHSALMRLPRSMPKKHKQEKAMETIRFLGLYHVRDTSIGNEEERGISGGQRKCVNIGMELVADPSVLFLDEPTSGLDSSTAFEVCKTLKDIAKLRMMTISAVIHSPSPSTFAQFDDLLLLGKGGEICYQGPRDACLKYFTERGFHFPSQPDETPADFIMNVVSGKVPCRHNPTFKPEDLFAVWRDCTSHIYNYEYNGPANNGKTTLDKPDERSVFRRSLDASADLISDFYHWSVDVLSELMRTILGVLFFFIGKKDPIRETPNFFVVFLLCLQRAFAQALRSPKKIFLDLALHLGCGCFISIAAQSMDYLGAQPAGICAITPVYLRPFCFNPIDHLREVGLFLSLGVLFAGISVGINTFGNERVVYWRDAASGMPALPYFLAKFIADIPRMIVAAFMFTLSLIFVWTYRSSVFYLYIIVLILYFSAFTMGYFISTIVKRDSASLVGTGMALAFGMVFSGVIPGLGDVFKEGSVYSYVSWIWRISPTRYLVEALYIVEAKARPWQELKDPKSQSYVTKEYNPDNLEYDLRISFLISFLWAFLALLGLKLLHREKQK